VDEQITGTKGSIYCGAMNITDRTGKVLYQYDKAKENNPYQTEHDELFAAIAKGEYKFADAENGAKSTMTSILGRMATYSGQVLEFDKNDELRNFHTTCNLRMGCRYAFEAGYQRILSRGGAWSYQVYRLILSQ